MDNMQTFELEWLIGIGLGALVIGLLLGLAMGRTVFRGKKSLDMEAELEAAQEALKDYRAEVYDQFAETARKFDTLNESYNDLHRHLASSANVLLGDGVSTPLLRGPAEASDAEGAQANEPVADDDSIEGEAQPVETPPDTDAAEPKASEPEPEPEETNSTAEPAPEGAADTTATPESSKGAEPAPKP